MRRYLQKNIFEREREREREHYTVGRGDKVLIKQRPTRTHQTKDKQNKTQISSCWGATTFVQKRHQKELTRERPDD